MAHTNDPARHTITKLIKIFALLCIFLFLVSPGAGQNSANIYLPLIKKPCPIPAIPQTGNWLDYLNYYRATACLAPVTENSTLSYGDSAHAKYMVKNDIITHEEDTNNAWYTPAGQSAAAESNLTGSYDVNQTDTWAIDTWMQAPFHAVGILDPFLKDVGYGSYREEDGNIQMGAALNILAGLGDTANRAYPVFWPGDGTTVPLNLHWIENPDPLTSCPGYLPPAGLPVILQIGPGQLVPSVSATAFTQNNQPLEHCVFDETSYINPDASQQSLGRSILGSRDAIVLIPRSPLVPGLNYQVAITVNGRSYTWSFTVSAAPHMVNDQSFIATGR